MSLAAKIKVLYPTAESLVDYRIAAGRENGERYERIEFWNTATLGPQPSSEAIDAVVVPVDRSRKQAELDAWWQNHPGVSITVNSQSVALSVQKTDVAINRLEILSATLEQRNARIFDANGLQITIQLADIPSASSTATAAIEAELTKYYTTQSIINSSTTQEDVDAIAMPSY